MSVHQIRLNLALRGGKVVVDETDISNVVSAVSVHQRAGQLPVVALEFGVVNVTDVTGLAAVRISDELHQALTALGWTPPA